MTCRLAPIPTHVCAPSRRRFGKWMRHPVMGYRRRSTLEAYDPRIAYMTCLFIDYSQEQVVRPIGKDIKYCRHIYR
jgi:hypothetical protein